MANKVHNKLLPVELNIILIYNVFYIKDWRLEKYLNGSNGAKQA